MSRRRKSIKRKILPDPKYNDLNLSKFINIIMKDGKKSIAERIVYNAFNLIHNETQENPLKVFKQAIEKVKPILEVKSRRVGGANYQVPIDVKTERGLALSFRWLKKAACERNENNMYIKLANELIDAYRDRGSAIKKRENTHKMAEANKAFAHYRW